MVATVKDGEGNRLLCKDQSEGVTQNSNNYYVTDTAQQKRVTLRRIKSSAARSRINSKISSAESYSSSDHSRLSDQHSLRVAQQNEGKRIRRTAKSAR